MRILITGSCGLIGSEAASYYLSRGNPVLGIDNNLRSYFFGPKGTTADMAKRLSTDFKSLYQHTMIDIRDREGLLTQFQKFKPDAIIHTAAQPSHDWAAKEPFTDFDVNAVGTLNLLEATRQKSPDAAFMFLSTNKVYGDAPNFVPLEELDTRYEYTGSRRGNGIDETLSVDGSLHSLFGASKLSADILCQEYGRYFGIKTGIFRGGCLTGSRHAGVKLHGFLSYLIDCAVTKTPYTIIGYKGKQVRDQIHSSDVIQALECFRDYPRAGEVYNLGGGYQNSASVLEVITLLKDEFNLQLKTTYVEAPRKGDHICYYSDLSKFQGHYPKFKLKLNLNQIIGEIISSTSQGKKAA